MRAASWCPTLAPASPAQPLEGELEIKRRKANASQNQEDNLEAVVPLRLPPAQRRPRGVLAPSRGAGAPH